MAMNAPKIESSELWRRTLDAKADGQELDRARLRLSLLSFRAKVAHIVSSIGSELAGLTVHDITHLDALWSVADEIVGPSYPINEAEAYVLGGAFLLHDAAHAVYAYEGGIKELKASVEWKDYVAMSLSGEEPVVGSSNEKQALFHVLRALHAHQAQILPEISWKTHNQESEFLIEDAELRGYYGQVIGEVAASHHWDPDKVVDHFRSRELTPPGFMNSSLWTVDVLKVAMILRLSDAAHIDSGRAPWFLFALRKPEGISKQHWQFQSNIGKVRRTSSGELKITSGRAFKPEESDAWWLAWDVANMIDRELKTSKLLLQQEGRLPFAAHSVQGISSAPAFAREVPVSRWEPVDVRPKVGDVPYLIERLGGAALYGDAPEVALRELIQNSFDACRALSALLDVEGGSVTVDLRRTSDDSWVLAVTDTGVGMSRYVLTDVLLDFGRSLWTSEVGSELPGLASSGFRSSGKFGIGFFSVFMLGGRVSVVTRRFDRSPQDESEQWKLDFKDGLRSRPSLSVPAAAERLKQCGTRVSVEISRSFLVDMLGPTDPDDDSELLSDLAALIESLAPASPVDLHTSVNGSQKLRVIAANDWKIIPDAELLSRVGIRATIARKIKALVNLYDNHGELVGRLLPAGRWAGRAVGTLHGINATSVSGLAGLVQISENNTNVVRTQACLFNDKASWLDWAERAEAELHKDDAKRLLVINPMLPNRDYRVWNFRNERIALSDLRSKLEDLHVLDLHMGAVEHSEEDETSASNFSAYFVPSEHLLIGPDSSYQLDGANALSDDDFPWAIGFTRIDYEARIRELVSQVWGKFVEGGYQVLVGEARGAEIYRDVVRFER